MANMSNKKTVCMREADASTRLASHIAELLDRQPGMLLRPLIILCIGSDRYIGDALGPLIGTYLLENGMFQVYGCLDHPVHAGNLVEMINSIQASHVQPFIIAIDACLGKRSEVGNVEVWEGGLEAGVAVGHRLPCIGDLSIVGVVNTGGHFGYMDLQTTPLAIVVKLSKVIGQALLAVLLGLFIPEAKPVQGDTTGRRDDPTLYIK